MAMKQLRQSCAAPIGATTLLAALAAVSPMTQAAGPALESGHEYMVVANYPNSIHVLDLADNSIYKSCKLPDAFGPGEIVMAPDHHTAYILNNHYADVYGVDLDSCQEVFHARMSLAPNERARTMFSVALSPDGRELYAVQNPTLLYADHYRVQDPRLAVYDTASGLDAKPVRTFKAPRQVTVMETGKDGSLYMVGPDIYRMNVHSGKIDVAIPSRHWTRKDYSQPDVLNVWPLQTALDDFSVLYTTAHYTDPQHDPDKADWLWGYMSVNLDTGKTETIDFAPITEVWFTGMRSPKDPNLMYTVLNHLAKYDIKQKKLLKSANLDHSYYCIAMNHAGTRVYLAGTFHDVAIYDADSLEKVGDIPLPGGDMAITTAQVFIR